MRGIKFRVWDGKTMTYPKTVEIGINGWNGLTSASYQLDCGGYCTSAYVMQFTGLLDKQGKEIYEGDIVAFESYNSFLGAWLIECRLPVEYYGDRFCARTNDHIHALNFLPNHIEVIGNIYENPELLKESK